MTATTSTTNATSAVGLPKTPPAQLLRRMLAALPLVALAAAAMAYAWDMGECLTRFVWEAGALALLVIVWFSALVVACRWVWRRLAPGAR